MCVEFWTCMGFVVGGLKLQVSMIHGKASTPRMIRTSIPQELWLRNKHTKTRMSEYSIGSPRARENETMRQKKPEPQFPYIKLNLCAASPFGDLKKNGT